MLAPRLRDHKKSLVSLLDDPRCTSCGSLLETAKHLELGANYSKVSGLAEEGGRLLLVQEGKDPC